MSLVTSPGRRDIPPSDPSSQDLGRSHAVVGLLWSGSFDKSLSAKIHIPGAGLNLKESLIIWDRLFLYEIRLEEMPAVWFSLTLPHGVVREIDLASAQKKRRCQYSSWHKVTELELRTKTDKDLNPCSATDCLWNFKVSLCVCVCVVYCMFHSIIDI